MQSSPACRIVYVAERTAEYEVFDVSTLLADAQHGLDHSSASIRSSRGWLGDELVWWLCSSVDNPDQCDGSAMAGQREAAGLRQGSSNTISEVGVACLTTY